MNKDQKEFRKLVREAVKLFRKKEWSASIAKWDEIISLLRDGSIKASAYTRRGNAKDKVGDHEGAIANYDRAIEINPQYARAYNNRGVAKSNMGNHEDAIADQGRAIEINPQYAKAYSNRGIAKRKIGDYKGAIADYDRAIEINPQYEAAYSNRGVAKSNMGDHEGAIADHGQAIEIDPKYSAAYSNRGIAKDRMDDHENAIADFNRAIEIDPKSTAAYNNRGIAKGNLGDHAGAIADHGRAIEIDPKNEQAIRNRTIALAMRRESQKGGKKIEEQLRAQQKQFDRSMREQLRAQQKQFDRSMREQLQTQQEEFDLKLQETIKQKTEEWKSANQDIIAALDYKTNLDECNQKLKEAANRVRFWMPVLTGASALAFISIAFFHFDINKPFGVLPLVAMVSLALSTLIWHIRMLNLDKHKYWALREDALANLTLARIVTSTGLRKELLERLFDHHLKRSSTHPINNSKHADTDSGSPINAQDIAKEIFKLIKPGDKDGK